MTDFPNDNNIQYSKNNIVTRVYRSDYDDSYYNRKRNNGYTTRYHFCRNLDEDKILNWALDICNLGNAYYYTRDAIFLKECIVQAYEFMERVSSYKSNKNYDVGYSLYYMFNESYRPAIDAIRNLRNAIVHEPYNATHVKYSEVMYYYKELDEMFYKLNGDEYEIFQIIRDRYIYFNEGNFYDKFYGKITCNSSISPEEINMNDTRNKKIKD